MAARAMVDQLADQLMRGELDANSSAAAKFWVSERQCEIIDTCLQFFGGYGYMDEYPISRMCIPMRACSAFMAGRTKLCVCWWPARFNRACFYSDGFQEASKHAIYLCTARGRAAPVIFLSVFLPVVGFSQEAPDVPRRCRRLRQRSQQKLMPEVGAEITPEAPPEVSAGGCTGSDGGAAPESGGPPMMRAGSGRCYSTRAALSHGLSQCCPPLACPSRRLNLCSFCVWKSGAQTC